MTAKGFAKRTATATKRDPELWYEQMMKSLPPNHKPDAGHIHYKTFGTKPVNLCLFNGFLGPDPKGAQFGCSAEDRFFSIFLTKKQSHDLFGFVPKVGPIIGDFEFYGLVKPALKQRYKAPNGEWVLPFVLVNS